VGIEQVYRRTREDRTVECSVGKEKKLCQEGIESVCRQAQKRKELFEFWNWRKYPLKDLHWVVEHPERLSKRLLEQEARKALYSPSVGEGRKDKIP
jgi:hypothetical protein